MILGELVRQLMGPISSNIKLGNFPDGIEMIGMDIWNGPTYTRIDSIKYNYKVTLDHSIEKYLDFIDNNIFFCNYVLSRPSSSSVISFYFFHDKTDSLLIGESRPHVKRIESWNTAQRASRLDGPAMTYFDINGNLIREEFWVDGVNLSDKTGITCLEELQNYLLLL